MYLTQQSQFLVDLSIFACSFLSFLTKTSGNFSINSDKLSFSINSFLITETSLQKVNCRDMVVITTAQLHSTKPEFRF